MDETRCGFVALIGAPNAGKSTLLNVLVGEKISIVTPKVQTTRSRVLGITIVNKTQIILIDTPGIFLPKRRLERAMVHTAWSTPTDADLTCLLIDVSKKDLADNLNFLDRLAEQKISPILILNKIDLVSRQRLLEVTHMLTKDREIKETFMLSALHNDGVADFKLYLADNLPTGPWLFPEDQITNMPMRLMAAEITREKLFMALRDELPYALMVATDKWENFKNGDVKISQTITVQREGQKKIILGKGGELIKKVGQRSRMELEKFLQCKVHLFLYVKVRSNWVEKPEYYQEMGLEFEN